MSFHEPGEYEISFGDVLAVPAYGSVAEPYKGIVVDTDPLLVASYKMEISGCSLGLIGSIEGSPLIIKLGQMSIVAILELLDDTFANRHNSALHPSLQIEYPEYRRIWEDMLTTNAAKVMIPWPFPEGSLGIGASSKHSMIGSASLRPPIHPNVARVLDHAGVVKV